jgi:hypothetical protein
VIRLFASISFAILVAANPSVSSIFFNLNLVNIPCLK